MSAAATRPNSPPTSSRKASRSSRWPSERQPSGTTIRYFDLPQKGRGIQQKEGSVTMANPAIRPFEVHVLDEDLAKLQRRIAATRWPGEEVVADRSQGVQLATIQ